MSDKNKSVERGPLELVLGLLSWCVSLYFIALPSFPVKTWMFLPLIALSIYRLRFRVLKPEILMVLFLVAWCYAADFLAAESTRGFVFLTNIWVPQVAAFLFIAAELVKADRKKVLFLVLSTGTLISAMVIAERTGINWHKILPSYKSFADSSGIVVGTDTLTSDANLVRLRGFYGEASVLSGYVVLHLLAILALTFGGSRRKLGWGYFGWACVVIVCLTGLMLLVLSKAGLVTFIAAGFCFLVAMAFRRRGKIAPRLISITILVGAAVAIPLSYNALPASMKSYIDEESKAISEALENTKDRGPLTGAQSRIDHAMLTYQVVHDNPFGSGFTGVKQAMLAPRLFQFNREMQQREAAGIAGLMNQFSDILAQAGIVGLLIMFLWMYFIMKTGGNPLPLPWGVALAAFYFAFIVTTESSFYLAVLPLLVATNRVLVAENSVQIYESTFVPPPSEDVEGEIPT